MESCYFIYKKQKKKILKKKIPALDATSYFLFSPVFTCADFFLIKLKNTANCQSNEHPSISPNHLSLSNTTFLLSLSAFNELLIGYFEVSCSGAEDSPSSDAIPPAFLILHQARGCTLSAKLFAMEFSLADARIRSLR